MQSMKKLLKDPRTEIFFLILIIASIITAITSLLSYSPILEYLNLAFSALFCSELTLRYLFLNNHDSQGRVQYAKTFWLDWIASIPWDILLINLFPYASGSLVLTKILRLPRLLRILRIISISRGRAGKKAGYFFKKQLEKSFIKQIVILLVCSFWIVVISSLALSSISDKPLSETLYFSLITLMSSDSIYEIQNDTSVYKAATIFLALLGIVLFNGIFIAIIVTRIKEYLDDIRDGIGFVSEKNHIVIVGWHPMLPYLLAEIDIHAFTEEQSISVVLLLEHVNPVFRSHLSRYKNIDIVVRRGIAHKAEDLRSVSITESKCAIINGDSRLEHDQQESCLVKAYLIMSSMIDQELRLSEYSKANNNHTHKPPPNTLFTVREGTQDNYLGCFKNDFFNTFDTNFYSAKILVSALIEPRLYEVFCNLFSYEGAEFHFTEIGVFAGWNFSTAQEIASRFNIIITGFIRSCRSDDGITTEQYHLVPSPETTIQSRDQLIFLSETQQIAEKCVRHTYKKPDTLSKSFSSSLCPSLIRNQHKDFSVVIIGVNLKIPLILSELLNFNCSILIIDNQSRESFEAWYFENSGNALGEKVAYKQCEFKHFSDIKETIPLEYIDRIVILADQNTPDDDPSSIDADTLFKILKILRISRESERQQKLALVAEVLSHDTQNVISLIPEVSFIVGPLIMGKLATMMMLEPRTRHIIRTLIQSGDTDIEVMSIQFPTSGAPISFGQLLADSRSPSVCLIGIITRSDARDETVLINPPHSTILNDGDLAIVMARSPAMAA